MYKKLKKNKFNENKLYNKILLLSRNKLFYTKFNLNDTFQNRINLIFFHISFIFIKNKQKNKKSALNVFYQDMFDLIFNKIELNMREIGHGDTTINKNMKSLVKVFYNILLFCEAYTNKNIKSKSLFLFNYLSVNIDKKDANMTYLAEYFNKYHAFCFDLSQDSVLNGELEFKVK